MEVFYSDSKTDLKLRRLYVARYYNTTHRNYPSNTRGTAVGTPVAVNTEFVDISDF